MERHIEFRGFDKQLQEWVYGFFRMFGKRALITEYAKPGIPEQTIEVSLDSVGQFTGLYDKNGKEIWEGDIVKAADPFIADKRPAVVKYVAPSFVADNGDHDDPYHLSFVGLEVIGNVYKNPELLTK